MGLDSYAVLGNTLDEYENDESQEDININSIQQKSFLSKRKIPTTNRQSPEICKPRESLVT